MFRPPPPRQASTLRQQGHFPGSFTCEVCSARVFFLQVDRLLFRNTIACRDQTSPIHSECRLDGVCTVDDECFST